MILMSHSFSQETNVFQTMNLRIIQNFIMGSKYIHQLSPIYTFWHGDFLEPGYFGTGTFRHRDISAWGHYGTGEYWHNDISAHGCFARYGLRRCVRARTRAMCSCTCACKMTSKTCVRSVCVRAFFPLVTPTHV